MLVFNGFTWQLDPLNVLNRCYERSKQLSEFGHLWNRRR